MTYNEILVGLTVHTSGELKCDKCPYYDDDNCADSLMTDALELILEQSYEIKRLKRENKILSINADNAFQDGLNEAQDLYAEQVKNEVRAEAIREFAERLGEHIEYRYNENCDFVPYVRLSDIEKVVYEMVGE